MKIKSWEASDEFWSIVEPLIPCPKRDRNKQYQRKEGGGRKPLAPRKVFAAIVYVLRTGVQWKALPKEVFGSPSSIHAYFELGKSKVSSWNFGSADFPSLTTWKESRGNGSPLTAAWSKHR